MANIEWNVVKLECGEEKGNAVFIDEQYAITVKHCIEPFLDDEINKIQLFFYNGTEYRTLEADLIAVSSDRDGFALLRAETKKSFCNVALTSCPVRPFEGYAAFGFNHNYNEKPSWRRLESISPDSIELPDTIGDLMFINKTKELSVEGLSGSPILPDDSSDRIVGLATQQSLERGITVDVRGISVLSQKSFLQENGILVENAEEIGVLTGLESNSNGVSGKNEAKYVPVQGFFDISHPSGFFGRDAKIKLVLDNIGKGKIILVTGEGGIGKTAFCRQILVKIAESGASYTAVSLIGCRTFDDMVRRIAGQQGVALGYKDDTDQIERMVFKRLNGILYLDNFEDVISEKYVTEEEYDKAISFLRKCLKIDHLTVLVSSRYLLEADFSVLKVELKELDNNAAINLFDYARDNKGLPLNDELKDFIINDLYRYPLSIVLVAKQTAYISTVKRLKEKWGSQRKKVSVKGMENKRHCSLDTALSMTFVEIKDNKNERALWELFTLFPDQIEETVAEKIIGGYDDVLRKLMNLGVVHLDDGYLFMLPTLREYIVETDDYPGDIGEISKKLLAYYTEIYGEDGKRIWGSAESANAVECLSDALYYMNWLVEREFVQDIEKIHFMLRNYYLDLPYEAVIPVEKAVIVLEIRDYIKANLLECCGNLKMRTDRLEEAEGHYLEAEGLYRRIQDDLGLANVLKEMGNFEMRTHKLEEAEGHYQEAEKLYRWIHNDLGLANVLRAMGDLERRTDKLEKAEGHYLEAEKLYRRIHNDLGLANVLRAMGDLKMRTAKLEEAEGYYLEAEELYCSIRDELGLANTLNAMGDLKMRTDKLEEAERYYHKAEELYRRIRDDLGLANVLQAMGDLERRTAKLEEAEGHYREAEKLYCRIHADLGLAKVLQAMGDLEMHTDKLEEAEGHYREAKELYTRIHADLGVANVLKAMGDLEMRTAKLKEAEGHYREAEELYRRIHADLGLANVLQVMGDLERCTDKLEEAEGHYREAEKLYCRIQDDLGLANVLKAMGNIFQSKIDYNSAIDIYRDAADLYIKTSEMIGLSYTASELCFCYAETGDRDSVRYYYDMVLSLLDSVPYENIKSYCLKKINEAWEKIKD